MNRNGGHTIVHKCLMAPVRAVCKLRDMYVTGMFSCAAGMGAQANSQVSGLPKSLSCASRDEDYAELMRIASTRSLGDRLDGGFLRWPEMAAPAIVPRSQSAAIGRIDEEKSCDSEDDFKVNLVEMFPRSKSHAIQRKFL